MNMRKYFLRFALEISYKNSAAAKAGKNKPTALQVKELNDLKRNGAITLVINESNLEELEDTIHVITLNNTNIYS